MILKGLLLLVQVNVIHYIRFILRKYFLIDDNIIVFFSGIPDTLNDYEKSELFADVGAGLGVL